MADYEQVNFSWEGSDLISLSIAEVIINFDWSNSNDYIILSSNFNVSFQNADDYILNLDFTLDSSTYILPDVSSLDFTLRNTDITINNVNVSFSDLPDYNNIIFSDNQSIDFNWSVASDYNSIIIDTSTNLVITGVPDIPTSNNLIILNDITISTVPSGDFNFQDEPLDVSIYGLQANFYFDNKNEYIETTLGRSTINGFILNTGEVGKLNTGVTYLLLNHGLQLNKALTTILINHGTQLNKSVAYALVNHGTQLNKSVAYALLQSVPTIEKASITIIAGEAVSFNKPKPHINFINT